MKRKTCLACTLALCLLAGAARGPSALAGETSGGYAISPRSGGGAKAESEWTVCIYMCGTDLESRNSCATGDLLQMIEADIPATATVLVMTGGATHWDPKGLAQQAVGEGRIGEGAYVRPRAGQTQIFEITDAGMELLHTYERSLPMDDMATAASFLEFALGYAPCEKLMVSFWDHGGGPLEGAVRDGYTGQWASLPEIAALATAVGDARGKKIDLIGFDACVSSNLETAALLAPCADYLVASEELEPAEGWNYLWLSNVGGSARDVGRAIVDAYAGTVRADDTWADARSLTLALTDLSRLPALTSAFSAMAEELGRSLGEPAKYAAVARAAEALEPIGGGAYGLLDLYQFAHSTRRVLTSAQGVIDALGAPPGDTPEHFVGETLGAAPAVVYRGAGADLSGCVGLAFYYPTAVHGLADQRDMGADAATYRSLGLFPAYSDYIDALLDESCALRAFDGELVVGFSSAHDCPTLTVPGADDALSIKEVFLELTYLQTNADGGTSAYHLGDLAVQADWGNTYFEAPIPVEWFAVNGSPCSVTDDSTPWYQAYIIPVIVGDNDFWSEMTLLRYPGEGAYTIDSIVDRPGGGGMAPRTYSPSGTLTFRAILWNGDDATDYIAGAPVTVSPNADGEYLLPAQTVPLAYGEDALYQARFVAVDLKGNEHHSSAITLANARSLSELTIAPIPPQIYTAQPVTPRLRYRYGDREVSQIGARLDIAYADNVAPGTAAVTVTSLEADFPGAISARFEIRPLEEIFCDVTESDWFFPAMNFLYTNAYMGGTGDGRFSPGGVLTRSMAVAILYRASSQDGRSDKEFADVSPDAYYYSAVQWAVENAIVTGYDGGVRFGPDDPITREQLMVILYRYAGSLGQTAPAEERPLAYADADAVSGFAVEAVRWMDGAGLVTGYADNTLRPQNTVTRMEAAALFTRLLSGGPLQLDPSR